MINSSKNNKLIMWVSIFIIAIIILVGLYYTLEYFGKEEKKETTEPETVGIDDRISPLGDQGLIVEINRIRDRELLDKILQTRNSWKSNPQFYYTISIDNLDDFSSKDVSAAGGASSELYFTDWDTMGQENRVMKDVKEEQETSDVTIKIYEHVNSGLLGLKSSDELKESIHVTYNYRTGRWSGDDYLKDNDGLGHYLGDNFEIWFNIYQTDYDGDYIPYWTEVNVLHTDPRVDDSKNDPDNDGIPTTWEWKWGYDPFTWDNHKSLDPDLDGIQNIEEYEMEKYFANPYSQDIYIEVDGMEKGGLFDTKHEWLEESGQIMIERFAAHGINLYIDNGWSTGLTNGGGELLTYYDTISQDSGVMLQFYDNHFADSRKGIFRYMIVAHNAGFCIPSEFNRYDTIVIDNSLYRLIKRTAFTARTQRLVLAAAAMHELGHSLGIAPWTFQGNDNLTFANGRAAKQKYADTWGDYYSVMNYYHIWDKNLVDYSDGSNGAPYDQNDWEHFYLPTFDIDSNAMEDPLIEAPGTDRIVFENFSPTNDKWMLDENLTNKNSGILKKMCYVKNVNYDINVYVPVNSTVANSKDRNVLVFAKPDTGATYSEWSLISEGKLNEDNTLVFYSQQNIIDSLYTK